MASPLAASTMMSINLLLLRKFMYEPGCTGGGVSRVSQMAILVVILMCSAEPVALRRACAIELCDRDLSARWPRLLLALRLVRLGAQDSPVLRVAATPVAATRSNGRPCIDYGLCDRSADRQG